MRKAYLDRITIIRPSVKIKWDLYSAGIALAQESARDAMLFKTLADFLKRCCLDRHCIEVAECNRGSCQHA
jgi:lambda repressor-like predicted transcriptional regulator